MPIQNINLGAYYYLWYGRPTLPVFGGVWKSGYSDQPILGEYNSRDTAVINQHIDWAKDALIDFFAINWSDIDSWDDITLKDYYLPNPKTSEIKFCLHYDSSLALNRLGVYPSFDFNQKYSSTKTKGEKFLDDFDYLAETYFKAPQYLKINNRTAVIIYNASAFRNISGYFEQLKINMARRGISLFLIGDIVCWSGIKLSKNILSFVWKHPLEEMAKILYRALRRLSLSNLEKDVNLNKYFDAVTGYNLYAINRIPNFLENVGGLYQKFKEYTNAKQVSFIPNIMPGYNDRNLKALDRPILERKEGEFYEDFWKTAGKFSDLSPRIVLITSFNEWHEGTEIEPSKEYGDKYLKLTKLLKNENTVNKS